MALHQWNKGCIPFKTLTYSFSSCSRISNLFSHHHFIHLNTDKLPPSLFLSSPACLPPLHLPTSSHFFPLFSSLLFPSSWPTLSSLALFSFPDHLLAAPPPLFPLVSFPFCLNQLWVLWHRQRKVLRLCSSARRSRPLLVCKEKGTHRWEL